jgi:hypothetical protein
MDDLEIQFHQSRWFFVIERQKFKWIEVIEGKFVSEYWESLLDVFMEFWD